MARQRNLPHAKRTNIRHWRRKRLGVAVSAIVGAAATTAPAAELETLIVTATKRAESVQDVSIALQAVSGDTLRELGVETFDEYVEYLPNVVSAGNGPGKKEIYIRGSATEQTSVTISSAQGSSPGVALYLDEQPVSFGGRNLDVYAADLERIEVASGPQGTLFGASSQSGNLRLITRKPNPAYFDTGFNTRYSSTASGSDSAAVDAFINLPLTDQLAMRVVVYSDNQGGWIDNIPATFTPSGEVVDRNNVAGYGPSLTGANSVQSVRNDALVQDDWNEASYRGARLGLSYAINDDWDLLVQHSEQTLEAEGSFVVDTSLDQDHASARFAPEFNRDDFGLTTWTASGRLAGLDVIYTGGHLNRDVDSVIDYTHYNNGGGYITYYLCSGNIYDATDVNNCYDPTKQYTDDSSNVRTTHEIRITTDQTKRWRILGGAYANTAEASHVGDFQYAATNDAFSEHINSYYNNNSGNGFLLGNTTLPTARRKRRRAAQPVHRVLQRLHAELGRSGIFRRVRLRPLRSVGHLAQRSSLRLDISAHRRLELLVRLPLRDRLQCPRDYRRSLQRHPTSATTYRYGCARLAHTPRTGDDNVIPLRPQSERRVTVLRATCSAAAAATRRRSMPSRQAI